MKYLYRIIALPFVFLWFALLVFSGLIFPTSLIMLASLAGLISYPFIWIINLGIKDKVIYMDTFLCDNLDDPNYIFEYIKGFTVLAWFPFYGCYIYYTKGEFLKLD